MRVQPSGCDRGFKTADRLILDDRNQTYYMDSSSGSRVPVAERLGTGQVKLGDQEWNAVRTDVFFLRMLLSNRLLASANVRSSA
ncbi:MAG: hypothetical protein JWP48_5229 [Actinoallomurus sp.]|jgi:hypothetical protein|nr:hypothetical protein [Actinoallomurus sp.]